MDFEQVIRLRRSIRSFTGEEVPERLLRALVRAGLAAPSAGNLQPWHIYILRSKKMREQLCECFPFAWPRQAPAFLVVCVDAERCASRYGERGRELFCLQDTAAVVENILLCSTSLGLGSCWIGSFEEDKCAQVLHLGQNLRPVAVLPVGYPGESQNAQRGERPLSEVVTWYD